MGSTSTRLKLRPQHQRRCPSFKVGFATEALAHTAAEHMMLQGNVNQGCHVTPYKCKQCGEWHVGNKVIVPVGRHYRRHRV